jgi:hypothetical protein
MKLVIACIILVVILSFPAYAGDHFGEYLDDQVPHDYEYPFWMKIFGEYFLRIIIGAMIFFTVSGIPENRLLSVRGFAGIFFTLTFFSVTILYHDLYTRILEIGFKSFTLFIGGILLLGIVFQALNSGLRKILNK